MSEQKIVLRCQNLGGTVPPCVPQIHTPPASRALSLGLATGRSWPPSGRSLEFGRTGDTDRSTQCPQPDLPCAFPMGWFPIEPALTFTPFPNSGVLGVEFSAEPWHAKPTGLTCPHPHSGLGSTSWTEKWAIPKRRFAREARPLVSVNKYRRAKNGAELQVTERTHPRCREDFGSSHLHANAQNPYKPVHTDAHKVVRGNPRRQDSPQTLLPLPTKTQAAKPLKPPNSSRPGARVYLSAGRCRCARRCDAAPVLPATRCCLRGGSPHAGCAHRRR